MEVLEKWVVDRSYVRVGKKFGIMGDIFVDCQWWMIHPGDESVRRLVSTSRERGRFYTADIDVLEDLEFFQI